MREEGDGPLVSKFNSRGGRSSATSTLNLKYEATKDGRRVKVRKGLYVGGGGCWWEDARPACASTTAGGDLTASVTASSYA